MVKRDDQSLILDSLNGKEVWQIWIQCFTLKMSLLAQKQWYREDSTSNTKI